MGDVIIYAGETEPITWQVQDVDIYHNYSDSDFVGLVSAELRLRNIETDAVKTFSTTGAQLTAGSTGLLTFTPLSTDFTTAGIWRFYFKLTYASQVVQLPKTSGDYPSLTVKSSF